MSKGPPYVNSFIFIFILFFWPFLSSPPHYKRLRYRDKKFRLEARQDSYAFYLLLLDKSDDNLVTSVKSKNIFLSFSFLLWLISWNQTQASETFLCRRFVGKWSGEGEEEITEKERQERREGSVAKWMRGQSEKDGMRIWVRVCVLHPEFTPSEIFKKQVAWERFLNWEVVKYRLLPLFVFLCYFASFAQKTH